MLSAPLSSWLFGARPEPVENRPLAEFPSLTEGFGFFTGLSAWATDHLPFRKHAVLLVGAISQGVFGEPAPVRGSAHGSQIGAARAHPTPPLDENAFPPVIEGRDGWLFLGHDVSYRCVPKRSLDEVIAGLRRWRSVVEASGREFQLVIAPDKSTMHPDRLPDE